MLPALAHVTVVVIPSAYTYAGETHSGGALPVAIGDVNGNSSSTIWPYPLRLFELV